MESNNDGFLSSSSVLCVCYNYYLSGKASYSYRNLHAHSSLLSTSLRVPTTPLPGVWEAMEEGGREGRRGEGREKEKREGGLGEREEGRLGRKTFRER